MSVSDGMRLLVAFAAAWFMFVVPTPAAAVPGECEPEPCPGDGLHEQIQEVVSLAVRTRECSYTQEGPIPVLPGRGCIPTSCDWDYDSWPWPRGECRGWRPG